MILHVLKKIYFSTNIYNNELEVNLIISIAFSLYLYFFTVLGKTKIRNHVQDISKQKIVLFSSPC